MAKKQMKMEMKNGLETDMQEAYKVKKCDTVYDFVLLHKDFMVEKTLEGLSPRTLSDHETHLKNFVDYVALEYRSNLNRVALDRDIFRNYVSYMMQERKYKPATINVRLRPLKCYLKWLFNEGKIGENLSIKIKLVKTLEDEIKPLSDADVKLMLKMPDKTSYAGFRDYCIMVLMLDNGIRVNETVNIKLDDIDLKLGLITIRAETAKTRISRQIPISKKTINLLKELIDINKANDVDYLFPTNAGDKANPKQIIQNFTRYGKKAGIKVRCTPHVWRHTFAVNAVKADMDVFTLQRIMGHRTLSTTRGYIQLEKSDLIEKHQRGNMVDKYIR